MALSRAGLGLANPKPIGLDSPELSRPSRSSPFRTGVDPSGSKEEPSRTVTSRESAKWNFRGCQ
jgi:hypothetical protein